MASGNNAINPAEYPYIYHADVLKFSYPCLGLLTYRLKSPDEPRQMVDEKCWDENGVYHPPGRCCALEFRASTTPPSVTPVQFKDVASLRTYLEQHSPLSGEPVSSDCNHRLYILEDLAPEYVEALGHHLHVDPLVFESQISSWRFVDTRTIEQRTLPSLKNPKESFTVRYPELRSFDYALDDWRWTFAANRRKIDPWFPIPGGRVEMKDQIALVRRCASFWVDNPEPGANRWNGTFSRILAMFINVNTINSVTPSRSSSGRLQRPSSSSIQRPSNLPRHQEALNYRPKSSTIRVRSPFQPTIQIRTPRSHTHPSSHQTDRRRFRHWKARVPQKAVSLR